MTNGPEKSCSIRFHCRGGMTSFVSSPTKTTRCASHESWKYHTRQFGIDGFKRIKNADKFARKDFRTNILHRYDDDEHFLDNDEQTIIILTSRLFTYVTKLTYTILYDLG
ncbi:hypothetical protein J6590_017047, partial [Homalodisca vitripennis]